jgi:hypothetical protein
MTTGTKWTLVVVAFLLAFGGMSWLTRTESGEALQERFDSGEASASAMVAISQVVLSDAMSFTVDVFHIEDLVGENTGEFSVQWNGLDGAIHYFWPTYEGGQHGVRAYVSVAEPHLQEDSVFLPIDDDGNVIGIECTIGIDGITVGSEVSESPIGEKGVTHAKEVHAADSLIISPTTPITMTAGEAEINFTPVTAHTIGERIDIATGTWHCSFLAVEAECPKTFYRVRSCKVGEAEIDTTHMNVESTGDGVDLRFVGEGDGNFRLEMTHEVHSYAQNLIWITAPLHYTYTGLSVVDMSNG